MISYGLSDVRIFPPRKGCFDVKGAFSIAETSDPPSVAPVYDSGELAYLQTVIPKQFSAKLTCYSELPKFKDPCVIAYKYLKHGLPAIGMLTNVLLHTDSITSNTLSDDVTPTPNIYLLDPLPTTFRGVLSSRILFEQRLMGSSNFSEIEERLYGQNDIVLDLQSEKTWSHLGTRNFRVLYNRYGTWEVSGPDHLIRNHSTGEWEVDNIKHIKLNEDEFIMIDDYEEDETWLP